MFLQGSNYTPPECGALRSAESSLQGVDDFHSEQALRAHHPGDVTLPLRWLKPAIPFIYKLFPAIIDKCGIIILNY